MQFLSIFWFCLWLICCESYEIPDVKFDTLENGGFRASIPADPTITFFAFNGFVTEKFQDNGEGDILEESYKPTGDRWVVENRNVKIEKGFKLPYYVVVQSGTKVLKKIGEYVYGQTEPIKENKAGECELSLTEVKGERKCKGELIFEDNFDSDALTGKWRVEQKLGASQPDAPFSVYKKANVEVKNGKLVLFTSFDSKNETTDVDSDIITPIYSVDLIKEGCTEPDLSSCVFKATSPSGLPAIYSGRINTKKSFTFKYGVVKVKAKAPTGFWLYPEILLEPYEHKYGPMYSSGTLIIAKTLGSATILPSFSGGPIVDRFECSDVFMKSVGVEEIHTEHEFELRWEPDKIVLSLDGKEYGTVKTSPGWRNDLSKCRDLQRSLQRWQYSGSANSPFDHEFYLVLGLGVAGVTSFPDKDIYVVRKPWKNQSAKGIQHFWRAKESWKDSWDGDRAKLIVDSVKVFAL